MSDVYRKYKYTLDQEVLKEYANDIIIELEKYMKNRKISFDDESNATTVLYRQLVRLEANIVDFENDDSRKIADISGFLMYMNKYVQLLRTEVSL